ncbi:aryl-sulfate sulfotransferase [Fibrobacterota bacterium]
MMKRENRKPVVAIVVVLMAWTSIYSQGEAFDGYTLYNPNGSQNTYLINLEGEAVHTWQNPEAGGYSVYLLEDGSILRPINLGNPYFSAGGASGGVERVSWEGEILWHYEYSNSTYCLHHDLEPLPNGNVLMIAWEKKNSSEAATAGRTITGDIMPDHIIEVMPQGDSAGEIVWEWHIWDHLIQDRNSAAENYGVVAEHPELLDINAGLIDRTGDWTHINAVSYNPELDQIVFSSHFLDEFYVIDHSTTTEEAAGHTGGTYGKGGDFLYRWGNPGNYKIAGTQFFHVVHCASWIPEGIPGAGNIMAYNNGTDRMRSEILEISPPLDTDGNYPLDPGVAYGPAEPGWTYTDSGFFSNHLGGLQRLPNGNTLVVESTDSGKIWEVTQGGEVVWQYNPATQVARALRYAPDYPGLAVLDVKKQRHSASGPETTFRISGQGTFYYLGNFKPEKAELLGIRGRLIKELLPEEENILWDGRLHDRSRAAPGVYLLRLLGEKSDILTRPVYLK